MALRIGSELTILLLVAGPALSIPINAARRLQDCATNKNTGGDTGLPVGACCTSGGQCKSTICDYTSWTCKDSQENGTTTSGQAASKKAELKKTDPIGGSGPQLSVSAPPSGDSAEWRHHNDVPRYAPDVLREPTFSWPKPSIVLLRALYIEDIDPFHRSGRDYARQPRYPVTTLVGINPPINGLMQYQEYQNGEGTYMDYVEPNDMWGHMVYLMKPPRPEDYPPGQSPPRPGEFAPISQRWLAPFYLNILIRAGYEVVASHSESQSDTFPYEVTWGDETKTYRREENLETWTLRLKP